MIVRPSPIAPRAASPFRRSGDGGCASAARRGVFGSLLLVALAFLGTQTFTSASAEVRLRASGEGLEGPATLEGGYHDVTLTNDGGLPYTVLMFRLKEGGSEAVLVPAVQAVDRAFAGEGDIVAALGAVLELADIHGELYADSGAGGTIGLVFEPGSYLFAGAAEPEGDEARRYTTVSLEVDGEAGALPPEADQAVQMVDFAFALPPDIEPGAQTWRITNAGRQIHHMQLLRLHEGTTMEELSAAMQADEGPPPADEVAYAGVMSAGRSAYLTLDLTPGQYVAICFMPDHLGDATGQPHFMLGMMQTFTIAGD